MSDPFLTLHRVTTQPHCLVAGERVEPLLLALFQILDGAKPTRDGMLHVETRLPSTVAAPFTRALMRVEAELLLADADTVVESLNACRTSDQRRHDALIALSHRVAAAMPQPPALTQQADDA